MAALYPNPDPNLWNHLQNQWVNSSNPYGSMLQKFKPKRHRKKGNAWLLDGPMRGVHEVSLLDRQIVVVSFKSGSAAFTRVDAALPTHTTMTSQQHTYERLGKLNNGRTIYKHVSSS